MKGLEKAALLLASLGEDGASEVMKHLNDNDIRDLGNYLVNLPSVTPEDMEGIYKEFLKLHVDSDIVPTVGSDYTRNVLIKALGDDKAGKVLEFLTEDNGGGLDSLKWLDDKAIANLVKQEHPQTAALILTSLEPKQAAAVFEMMPEHMKGDTIYRMATIETISPEVLVELEEVIKNELDAAGSIDKRTLGGKKFVADILNMLGKTTGEEAINSITGFSDKLAEDIQGMMFVFADLEKVDDRGVRELLKEVEREDLILSMKGASDFFKDMIFRNMSSRAVEMLKDDIESKGPVKLVDVEKSQQQFLKTAKQLAEEGKISLGGEGEDVVL